MTADDQALCELGLPRCGSPRRRHILLSEEPMVSSALSADPCRLARLLTPPPDSADLTSSRRRAGQGQGHRRRGAPLSSEDSGGGRAAVDVDHEVSRPDHRWQERSGAVADQGTRTWFSIGDRIRQGIGNKFENSDVDKKKDLYTNVCEQLNSESQAFGVENNVRKDGHCSNRFGAKENNDGRFRRKLFRSHCMHSFDSDTFENDNHADFTKQHGYACHKITSDVLADAAVKRTDRLARSGSSFSSGFEDCDDQSADEYDVHVEWPQNPLSCPIIEVTSPLNSSGSETYIANVDLFSIDKARPENVMDRGGGNDDASGDDTDVDDDDKNDNNECNGNANNVNDDATLEKSQSTFEEDSDADTDTDFWSIIKSAGSEERHEQHIDSDVDFWSVIHGESNERSNVSRNNSEQNLKETHSNVIESTTCDLNKFRHRRQQSASSSEDSVERSAHSEDIDFWSIINSRNGDNTTTIDTSDVSKRERQYDDWLIKVEKRNERLQQELQKTSSKDGRVKPITFLATPLPLDTRQTDTTIVSTEINKIDQSKLNLPCHKQVGVNIRVDVSDINSTEICNENNQINYFEPNALSSYQKGPALNLSSSSECESNISTLPLSEEKSNYKTQLKLVPTYVNPVEPVESFETSDYHIPIKKAPADFLNDSLLEVNNFIKKVRKSSFYITGKLCEKNIALSDAIHSKSVQNYKSPKDMLSFKAALKFFRDQDFESDSKCLKHRTPATERIDNAEYPPTTINPTPPLTSAGSGVVSTPTTVHEATDARSLPGSRSDLTVTVHENTALRYSDQITPARETLPAQYANPPLGYRAQPACRLTKPQHLPAAGMRFQSPKKPSPPPPRPARSVFLSPRLTERGASHVQEMAARSPSRTRILTVAGAPLSAGAEAPRRSPSHYANGSSSASASSHHSAARPNVPPPQQIHHRSTAYCVPTCERIEQQTLAESAGAVAADRPTLRYAGGNIPSRVFHALDSEYPAPEVAHGRGAVLSELRAVSSGQAPRPARPGAAPSRSFRLLQQEYGAQDTPPAHQQEPVQERQQQRPAAISKTYRMLQADPGVVPSVLGRNRR